MDFNLHHLRLFVAVVKNAGFSKAAKSLYISQPAISKMVGELEKQVGVPLLERGARSVMLTEAGKVLYEHALTIFAAEHTAGQELEAIRGLEGGTLRIGASTTIANYWLPPYLAEFSQRHPAVKVLFTSANTHDIAQLLLEYELDIALVEGPVKNVRLTTHPWKMEDLVFVCSPQHPLAQRKRIDKRSLKGLELVMREKGSGTREVTEMALAAAGISWKPLLETTSTEVIKRVVEAGMGAAIVSLAAAKNLVDLGRLRILSIPHLQHSRPLYHLTLRNRRPSTAARSFMALLNEESALRD